MKNPTLKKPISQTAAADSSFLYTGPSMLPTFHPGDSFTVDKIPLGCLRPGDIVIFSQSHSENETITVIHRIVVRRAGQWFTRGDNNLHLDPLPLDESSYQGRVETLERSQQKHRVVNGAAGWVYAQWLYGKNRGWMGFKQIFHPLYGLVRTFNLRTRLWHPKILALMIRTQDGILVKYLFRRHTVARYRLRTGVFWCRKPFDLVIQQPVRFGQLPGHQELP